LFAEAPQTRSWKMILLRRATAGGAKNTLLEKGAKQFRSCRHPLFDAVTDLTV